MHPKSVHNPFIVKHNLPSMPTERIVSYDYTATYVQLRKQANRPLISDERNRNIVLAMLEIFHGFGPISLKSLINYLFKCIFTDKSYFNKIPFYNLVL